MLLLYPYLTSLLLGGVSRLLTRCIVPLRAVFLIVITPCIMLLPIVYTGRPVRVSTRYIAIPLAVKALEYTSLRLVPLNRLQLLGFY